MKFTPARLEAICSLKTGKLDSNAAIVDGQYPFFTCAPETLRIDKPAFDTEAVLLAGNNAAGIYPLKYYHGEFNAYQRTYVIESFDNDVLSIRYLYYALHRALAHFQSVSIGASTQYLTKSILNNFVVQLPSLVTQNAVVAILSAYDDLIENNRRRMELLEDAARQLYREWFVRLRFPGYEHTRIINGVPEGWEQKPLGEVTTLNYGKALKEDDRREGTVPVYGSSGVVGNHDEPLITSSGIIVGRKGNVGSVFWSDSPFWAIDTVYFVSPEESSLYLFHCLQYLPFQSSDVAVPGLNRTYAHSLKILLPRGTIRNQFEEIVSPMFTQMAKLRGMNQKLRAARDLLLPRLMSGEIPV